VAIVAALAVVAAGIPANKVPNLPVKPKCSSSDTYRLPYPQDCTFYYICQDGEITVHQCPEGLHFNDFTKQCDWPPAGCSEGNRPETQPNASDTEDIESDRSRCIGTCPIPDPMDRTIHLPYRGDCTKFCKCSNGTPYVMPCPDGLHWDKKWDVCDWWWKAQCDW